MTLPTDSPDAGTVVVTDDQLIDYAVDFLDAMLRSADVAVIGVNRWWDRAKTALETGCYAGSNVREVTTRVARKLQIDTLQIETAEQIDRLAQALRDPDLFARWRRLAARDAVFVAAMVRLRRDDRKTARAAAKPATAAPKASAAVDAPIF
jgi:hypothetical protein